MQEPIGNFLQNKQTKQVNMEHEEEITSKISGYIECDCGSTYTFNGILSEDDLYDLMDALDDCNSVSIIHTKPDEENK